MAEPNYCLLLGIAVPVAFAVGAYLANRRAERLAKSVHIQLEKTRGELDEVNAILDGFDKRSVTNGNESVA